MSSMCVRQRADDQLVEGVREAAAPASAEHL